MICISLADISFEECFDAVGHVEFAEIRFDLLNLSDDQINKLFSANSNLIATCRPGRYDEETRKAILLRAIEAGAAYVDVEMESDDGLKEEIVKAARAKGCRIIISYHNFEKTPKRAELDYILRWCEEFTPDIVKVACMVRQEQDNARLLGLLDTNRPMIVIGMGEKGKLTRAVSPILGSFCTFAAYTSDKATAPGQLFKDDLEALITRLMKI